MFKLLLVIHSLIAASLVGVILMQRSEGGGLAGGGSPAGLLSARGAGDFLTRTTAILATIFILLSIALAGFATVNRRPTQLDESLKKEAPALPGLPGVGQVGPAPGTAPVVGAPVDQPNASDLPAVAGPQQVPTPAVVERMPGRTPEAAERPAAKPVARVEERRPAADPKPKAAAPAPVKLPPITAPAPKMEIPAQAPAAPAVQGPPAPESSQP